MADKIRPVDFKTANARLGNKDRVKLDRNTYLERHGDKTIAVRLHDTDIVIYRPTYTELDSGGWHTMTTRQRMDSYIPMALATHPRSWSLYPVVEVDCYCADDHVRGDGIVVDGEWKVGMRHEWAELYELPDGTRVDTHDPAWLPGYAKPVYRYAPCPTCQGTGRRMGHDWDSGGYVYFDGVRIKPNGSKLMASQPNRPHGAHEPVVTQSGFTGRRLAGFGSRS